MKKQKGLYIADATLLNGPLYHNPQGSIMSIAKRNLEHWIRDTDNLSSR
jgi:choline dehydrogenase-like flavoprotein